MLHAQGSITIRRRPKDGNPGADAVRYWLVPSVSQIKKTDDGKFHPTSITCEKRKQTGNSSPIATSEGTLKYQIGYTDNSVSALTNYSSAITIPAKCQWIKFVLYVNSIDVATETVPVVADGESVFLLDLDNEMQGIPCNSSGTPTISGTLASTNSTVYKGASIDSGWTFSKTDSGCTSSINASTGVVTVTAISADKASVTVNATKGSQTLSAVMSLYKVKAGADGKNGTNGTNGTNGESPVIYSIEASVSAISRNASGTLSPTTITAYKNKTVGSSTTRTKDKTLKYKRVGQDTAETTLANEGGEIKSINASCTAIELKIYDTDGTTILDSERIPIVKDGSNGKDGENGKDGQNGKDGENGKDGSDGEDAVRYWLVPSESTIIRSRTGSYSPAGISCDAMYQSGTDAATSTTNVFIRYKYTYASGLVQNWKKYNFNTSVVVPSGARSLLLELYLNQGSNVSGDVTGVGSCLDKLTIPVMYDGQNGADGSDGVDGAPGKQGIQGCVYRRSKFDTGFEYHNDSALTNDGIRYIDLVYIMKDNTMYASHALWFRCKKTHTSSDENAPRVGDKDRQKWDAYWEPMNTLEPLYTPLLLADDAVITLMQSNQILIANDDGVITAGMSGSLSGSKIRIWAGAETPDNAPFRVDVNGSLVATKANITGTIKATEGKIAGFNISGNTLTNGPEFSNDACIIFRNDSQHTFAGIGGDVLPATTGNKAVARFENEDSNNFWGLGRNIAMLLSAKNADINHAFLGSGNGNLDGWIGGYHYSKYTLNAANTIYNGYLKIAQNNKWVVYAIGKSSGITLPTLSEVRSALGIGSSTAFCVEFTIVADVLTQNNFHVYGRTQKKVTVNGSEQTPYYNGEYPTVVNQNGQRVDSWEMGGGDSITYLLIYDPNKSGSLDSTYSLMYSARIINYQQ